MQRHTSPHSLVSLSLSLAPRFSQRLACSVCLLAMCAMPAITHAKNILPTLTEAASQQPAIVTALPTKTAPPSALSTASVMRGGITEDAKLLKVVVLARHGVRSPVQSAQELEQWSQKAWPTWPVAPGHLTLRGAELVSYLWGNLRDQLSAEALPAAPDSGCPPLGSVFVHADNEERTLATASALLEGFAPGCGLSYVYVDSTGVLVSASPTPENADAITASFEQHRLDPLFHPVRAGICTPSHNDAINTVAQINIKSMEQSLRQPLTLMSKLVGKANGDLCIRHRARADCTAPLLPTKVIVNAHGEAHLEGGLGIASSIAEIWLLEAAQWPTTNPAWNGLDTATLQRLLPVHTVPFNAVQRSSAIAKAQGSGLLDAMVKALSSPTDSPSLVIFVGHDTSIAHVASLLDLNWKAQSWPENSVPPGAVLLLSLWESQGQKLVSASFVSQSLGVMRSDDPQILTQASPEWVNLNWSQLFPQAPTPNGPAIPLSSLVARLPSLLNPHCL